MAITEYKNILLKDGNGKALLPITLSYYVEYTNGVSVKAYLDTLGADVEYSKSYIDTINDSIDEINEKIRKIKREKREYKDKAKEEKNAKLRAIGTFAAEFVSGVAPFTVTYRAIKKRNHRKNSFSTSKDDSTEHNA